MSTIRRTTDAAVTVAPVDFNPLDARYAAVATTAALAAVGNAINTSGKRVGKQVFNTTTNKPVWAIGALANSVWADHAGVTAHTPV